MRCKWSDISKYRGELFGIAIISVIILHYLGTLHSGETNSNPYCGQEPDGHSAVRSAQSADLSASFGNSDPTRQVFCYASKSKTV